MKIKNLLFIILALMISMDGTAKTRPHRKAASPHPPPPVRNLPKILQAEHQEFTEDRLIASGKVEIAWEEYRIYADYLELNRKTHEITAEGRVTMVSNQTVISGDKLTFNLSDRSGVLYDVYGQVPPSITYKTRKLTQVDNDTLRFDKINFTSCTQFVPRWNLTCSKGKIKKEKYIEMKDVVFKIKKIPVFYFPYMRYPLNANGRATGFLFPGIGRSNLRGFFLLNSFYWNIKPNLDLTMGLDYYGKAGIGGSGEFRYLFPSMNGDIKFYYFKYKPDVVMEKGEIPPANSFYSVNPHDYYLRMTHQQKFGFLKTKLNIDVDKQSDANFLRLFSNDFEAVLRRISRSSVSIDSSLANNIKFSALGSIYDTYYTFNNSSRSLRYLPQVALNWNQQRIWKIPGYFSLDTSYSAVQRVGKDYDEDQGLFTTDVRTQRMNINPSYSLGLIRAPWMSVNLDLNSRHSIYFKSRDPKAKKLVIVNELLHLYYNSAEVNLKGPVFSRIFEAKKSKTKHVIEPAITVRYVTKVDEEDRARLIPVDNFDYPPYSFVGFSLTNRLLKKGNNSKSAWEILSYTIAQQYYFDPETAHRNRKINGIYPEFSELENTLRFRPFKNFTLDAQLIYNYYLEKPGLFNNFSRIQVGVSYNDWNSFINGNFHYNRYLNPYLSKENVFNRDVVGGRLNLDIPNFPLKLDSTINYDITAKQFLHASIKLIYDYQCLKIMGELRMFKYSGRVETQLNFGITFGNLGAVKDFLGVPD